MPVIESLDATTQVALSELEHLLDFLPALYPGGSAWLRCRFADVTRGDAHLAWSRTDGHLAGVAIGVLKPDARFKICTLYVDPEFRRFGLGSRLLDQMLGTAVASGSQVVYITVAHSLEAQLLPLLSSRGFTRTAFVSDRYGAGRHEAVYSVHLPSS